MSPALAGGFFITGPSGKFQVDFKIQTPYCVLLEPIAGVHQPRQVGAPPAFVNKVLWEHGHGD